MKFIDKCKTVQKLNNSLLCVGLDPDPDSLQKGQSQFDFNKIIIDSTASVVCCYKPQIAFYAAAGESGLASLKQTVDYIHKNYPQIPVLLDAKRSDVPNTSKMYAKEVFDVIGADAVTVTPYCGFDSLEPFFKREEKGVFVICRTSNPSAADFQDLKVGKNPLYVEVAKKIVNWSKIHQNVYLEIGATWPGEIGVLRKLAPDMLFLIAGVGAQGGDLKATVKNGLTKDGDGLIINSSRGIIYAHDPKKAAGDLKNEINEYRK